jgi:putative hemolysin
MEPHLVRSAPYFIVALIAVNAIFVAVEFALVTSRRSPAETDETRSHARANELVLFAQLGSTLATLMLGYLVATLVWAADDVGSAPSWLTREMKTALVLIFVAFGHVILGEQIPRMLGSQRASWIMARAVRPVFSWLAIPFRVLTWPLARLTNLLARGMGLRPGAFVEGLAHTPEEIQRLVAQSHAEGVVEEDEQEMIQSVFQFSTTVAREVMTPRTDMTAISIDCTLEDLLPIVLGEEHSRLPVYEDTLDTIIGVLLVKDLLAVLASPERRAGFDLREVMREPYFVPDTKPVDEILAEFRTKNVHMAIVLDEFGGTYGIVTLEDVLEELVGEIHDEYDVAEPDFTATPEGDVLIDGGTLIFEVNERFGFALPVEDYDTIAGFTFGALGRVPVEGDQVEVPGSDGLWHLRVELVEDRRITQLRLVQVQATPEAALAAD